MLQIHQKYSICLRRFECGDIVLQSLEIVYGVLVLDTHHRQCFGNVHQRERRLRENQEFSG